jgi:AbrB family looped-hinge helix DNA binding protein
MEVTMAMITAMSTRGQIVIPKKIRTALKLDTCTQFIVFSDNDNILLKPIKEPKLSDFEQLLNKAQKFASDNGMQETDIAEAIKSVRKKS